MFTRPRLFVAGRVVLLCLAGGLIAGGVYLWQNLVFTGQIRPIPDTPHHFLIQNDVSEDMLALVTEGLVLSQNYFSSQLGATLQNPIEIRLAQTTPCIPFVPLASNPTAVADKTSMCLNMIGTTWSQVVPSNPRIGLSIIAHEHFHNLQAQAGCLPGPNDHEYAWWVEGSATYVGWQTLVHAGLIADDDVLDVMREWGGFSAGLGRLATYELSISGDAAYALGYRAIQALITQTGNPQTLYRFCQRVGQGEDWRRAFETVYGLPVETFYAQFEAQRSGS